MRKIFSVIAIAALLTGCATTKFDSLDLKGRTVKFSIFGIIEYEHTTEALVAGGVEITKDQ